MLGDAKLFKDKTTIDGTHEVLKCLRRKPKRKEEVRCIYDFSAPKKLPNDCVKCPEAIKEQHCRRPLARFGLPLKRSNLQVREIGGSMSKSAILPLSRNSTKVWHKLLAQKPNPFLARMVF